MLLDADLGLANVDVLLGIRARLNLEHVLAGECALEDIVVTAPSGLRVVPASSGNVDMAALGQVRHAGLIHAFSQLLEPLDVLLIDTAAGLSDSVLTFSKTAHHVVVVACDEPASLTDAYALIKALSRREPDCRIEVLSNMVEGPAHGRALYAKLSRVCERFLSLTPVYCGFVPYDEYLRRAVQRQSTVVERYPSSPGARAFRALAATVDAWSVPNGARGGVEFFVERQLAGGRRTAGALQ
jgi:flagellar biosynthesis protein FlhG